MRTPKAPAGFVPVDSEEARKIEDNATVDYAYVLDGVWMFGNTSMRIVRGWKIEYHYHVQLPPPVEWEEVWGCKEDDHGFYLTKNGHRIYDKHTYSYIAKALNELEGRDG